MMIQPTHHRWLDGRAAMAGKCPDREQERASPRALGHAVEESRHE